jgi:CspA family cold shock protein
MTRRVRFITPDDGSEDLFAHFRDPDAGLQDPEEGQKVSFDVTRAKGKQASNIQAA